MTLLKSVGRAGDTVIYMYIRQVALSVISFRRAVICDLSQITEKVIDYESRLFGYQLDRACFQRREASFIFDTRNHTVSVS